MRNKYIMLLLVVSIMQCSTRLFSQVPDTSAYLEQLVQDESKYIGMSFSEFEKTLRIKVLSFSPMAGSSFDIKPEGFTILFFVKPEDKKKFYDANNDDVAPGIVISWKKDLNLLIGDSLYKKYNNGTWNADVREHYKDGIIDGFYIFGD